MLEIDNLHCNIANRKEFDDRHSGAAKRNPESSAAAEP
jgi:hypothetical protein